jgi:hypothetical protein
VSAVPRQSTKAYCPRGAHRTEAKRSTRRLAPASGRNQLEARRLIPRSTLSLVVCHGGDGGQGARLLLVVVTAEQEG